VLVDQAYHEAAAIYRDGDRSREDPRPFPGTCICPDCLASYVGNPDPDPAYADDPWWLRRRTLKDLQALRPDSPTSREEAFLFGTAGVHLARFLSKEGKVDPGPISALADAWLAAAPGLPPLRRRKVGLADEELRVACEVFRGFVPLFRKDMEGAEEHWKKAASTGSGAWSGEAKRQLEALEKKQREALQLDRGIALAKEAQAAHASGNETEELRALEELASLEIPPSNGDEWIPTRRAFLRVVVGGSRDPSDLTNALVDQRDDPRLRTALWDAGRSWGQAGRPADAIRLLRKLGPSKDWSPQELRTFANWAGQAGQPRLRASTLRMLARKDCACVAEAARATVAAGDLLTATSFLLEDARSSCCIADHRRQAYETVLDLPGAEVKEVTARAWLEASPGDPSARAAVARGESEALRRAQARAREASREALAAARDESWPRVEQALEGVDAGLLTDEVLRHLAHAKVQLGRPLEGARTQLLRGQEPEILVQAALWFLQAREPTEALRALRPLAEGVLDGEDPAWLGNVLGTGLPDISAVSLAAVGRLREAVLRALDGGLLRALAKEARTKGDEISEGLALCRLQGSEGLTDAERTRLPALRDRLPLGLKAKAGAPLGDERRIVLLDTNVLIDLLLQKVGENRGCGLHLREQVADRAHELGADHATLAVPSVTANEFLARVGAPPDPDAEDEQVEALVEAAEGLVEGFSLDGLLGSEVRAGDEHRERAETFFRAHHERLQELTESKVRKDPDRAPEIRRKRHGSGATLPEAGDIWLLAQALRLQELPAPGISSVCILSDDRDFRDLRGAIREAFGIEVL
ncbi:MAG: hypothetical protein KGJ69_16535, partial [Thermoplasmata archaeon]|nr:hypothetical protein [Thermoplasmata archaeon]